MTAPRREITSPHPVLPPIVSAERDRDFLVTLNAYIDKELTKIDSHHPEQRYIIYKAAFDRVSYLDPPYDLVLIIPNKTYAFLIY